MTQFYARSDTAYSGNSIFTVPFPYISKEHIKVYINDEETTNYQFLNDTQINITDSLINDDIVSIRRITPIDEKIVTYQNMSMVLNDDNLNLSQDQSINAIQELYDNNAQFEINTTETIEANKQELIGIIDTNKTELENAQTEFETEINNTLDAVISAAEKLEILDESVERAENAATAAEQSANTATAEANEAASKAEEATEQAQLATQKAQEASDKVVEIDGKLVTKANVELDNLSEEGKTKILEGKITNCILEIPQRIKLEYENNVSGALKAGSQVIIPSGFEDDGVTPKFVYKEIEQDITFTLTATSSTSRVGCAWYKSGSIAANVNRFSGDTAPTFIGAAIWYDTANNIIKNSSDSGATWNSGEYSLPIAEVSINTEDQQITQVFNGMGYIGSTCWVNKGVKVLMPNGRNADGTLNNIEYTTDKDYSFTVPAGYGQEFYIGFISSNQNFPTAVIYEESETRPANSNNYFWRNTLTNKLYFKGASSEELDVTGDMFVFAFVRKEASPSSTITSLTPYQPVELLKRSDLDMISSPFTSPTGTIIAYGSATAPNGYLKCNGAAISRTTYSGLFSVTGTTYGAGDGSTTFNIPNFTGGVVPTSNSVAVKGNGQMTMYDYNNSISGPLVQSSGGSGRHLNVTQIGTSNTAVGITTNSSKSGIVGTLTSKAINYYIKY